MLAKHDRFMLTFMQMNEFPFSISFEDRTPTWSTTFLCV